MKGIYSITNPSGSIYIGQSKNIERRFGNHKNQNYNSNCYLLARSFKKYGIENHVFKVLHELPEDVADSVLNEYETFCIGQYKEAGVRLLNVKMTANNHNEETKAKISAKLKGVKKSAEHIEKHRKAITGRPSPKKGTKLSEETKGKIREARAKQTNVVGPPIGHIPWNKGVSYPNLKNRGKRISEEQKKQISASLTGRKLSAETIAKRTETRRTNGWNKRDKK